MKQETLMKVAEAIINAMHLESQWSKRSIPVISWQERSSACHESIAKVIEKHLTSETLPSPREQHQIWVDEHLKMGWKYGKERDLAAKIHPNLVDYDELPEEEKDKDTLFLTLVALVKMLIEKNVISL
jgi:ryanodine receptor 2